MHFQQANPKGKRKSGEILAAHSHTHITIATIQAKILPSSQSGNQNKHIQCFTPILTGVAHAAAEHSNWFQGLRSIQSLGWEKTHLNRGGDTPSTANCISQSGECSPKKHIPSPVLLEPDVRMGTILTLKQLLSIWEKGDASKKNRTVGNHSSSRGKRLPLKRDGLTVRSPIVANVDDYPYTGKAIFCCHSNIHVWSKKNRHIWNLAVNSSEQYCNHLSMNGHTWKASIYIDICTHRHGSL